MEICFLSCYLSTYIVSLILLLGLQNLKYLLFGFYRKSLLAPSLEHHFPTCCLCKIVIGKVILGVISRSFFFNSYDFNLLCIRRAVQLVY